MNIVCRKTVCKFNKNFVCYAKEIDITKNSICDTFIQEQDFVPDTSKSILKKTPKYNPYRAVKKLKIICCADCQFNKEKNCYANGITVNSLNECPYCVTYFRKIKK